MAGYLLTERVGRTIVSVDGVHDYSVSDPRADPSAWLLHVCAKWWSIGGAAGGMGDAEPPLWLNDGPVPTPGMAPHVLGSSMSSSVSFVELTQVSCWYAVIVSKNDWAQQPAVANAVHPWYNPANRRRRGDQNTVDEPHKVHCGGRGALGPKAPSPTGVYPGPCTGGCWGHPSRQLGS